jgi:hypothetical protein
MIVNKVGTRTRKRRGKIKKWSITIEKKTIKGKAYNVFYGVQLRNLHDFVWHIQGASGIVARFVTQI